MNFENKVVLITGGSSGIGAGIAVSFAKEKANVVIIGRNETKLNNVAAELQKYTKNVFTIKADISKENDVKVIVAKTIRRFQRIDVLVNNAGIFRYCSILEKNVLEAYDEVMNTNVRAAVQLVNLCVPYLVQTKGNVINISSVASTILFESPHYISYCVSKAALDHLTRALAAELAPKGVRVNVVNPGPVKTDIAENIGYSADESKVFFDNLKKNTFLDRVSDPEEIGDLVVFLASDKARGITGSSFVSDNGMILKGRI